MVDQRLRIALLDASGEDGTPRNFRRELDADLVEFDVTAGDLPSEDGFDAVVVTGSRASVYWDEPWINPLVSWVADAHDRGLPVLGVCFGHQVLATALGGSVEDMGDFELGYRTVEHHGGSLFEGIDDRFTVFVTHGDEVTSLPPGGMLLAENEYSIHGFRKDHSFGIQFHPEYDIETAETVAGQKDSELPADRYQHALRSITPENFRAACEAKQVFSNFTAHVRDRRRSGDLPASD